MKTIYTFAIPGGILPGDYIVYAVCECGKWLQAHESSTKGFARDDIRFPGYQKYYRKHVKGNFTITWIADPERDTTLQAILDKSENKVMRELFI